MQLILPRILKRTLLYSSLSMACLQAVSQSYSDGPITLQAKFRDMQVTLASNSDFTLNIGSLPLGPYTDDEYTFKVYARDDMDLDATGYTGGTCHTQTFVTVPNFSSDFNDLIFNYTYPTATVPQFLDINVDAYEEDLPVDFSPAAVAALNVCDNPPRATCQFDVLTCCVTIPVFGCVFSEADDIRCNPAVFFNNLNYRMGPPCQWYSHGYLVGSCGATNYYQPRIETFWRYSNGTSCAAPIPIGPGGGLAPGFAAFSHFNSNECYTNNFASSPGNDVFYQINVTTPVGITASLCGGATWDTYLYLLNSSCTPIIGDDNGCASNSVINYALCTPGTYYLVVDGATAGAMGTFTLLISENASLVPQADAGSDKTSCAGVAEQIGTTPGYSGGVGPFTFDWSPGLLVTDSAITNPFGFPLTTTDFIFTVTDVSTGCVSSDTMTLLINTPPSVNLGNDTTLCPDASLTLDAGSGYVAYFWNTGATGVSTQTIDDPGLYFVNVIDIFGCLGNDTINVLNFPTPLVNLGPDTSICSGASLTLNAPVGMSAYDWSTGATAVDNISVSTAGNYDVTITDVNGCQRADTVSVGINPLPIVTVNDITVCPGDDAFIDAGAGFAGYLWSTGAIGQFITTNVPGAYDVTVTDLNGCEGTDGMTLSNYPAASVSLGPDQGLCPGDVIVLDAGAGFSSYSWSTGASTQTINVIFPGTYIVMVVNSSGCVAYDTLNVTPDVLPTVDLGNDQDLCPGASITLDAGPGFSSYAWSTGGTSQTENVTAGGVVTATVTNAAGCQATDDMTVTLVPAPTVDLGPATLSACDSGNVMLDAGPGMQTYLWSDGSTDQYLFVNASGVYSVTVTNEFGCTATDNITVNLTSVSAAPLLGPDRSFCVGEDLLLDAGVFTSYVWQDGSVNQYLLVNVAGTYSVEVIDAGGCRFRDTVVVTEETPPPFDLGPPISLCNGETETLDAGAGFTTYLWSTGATTQTIDVSASGQYEVTVTVGTCTLTDQVAVDTECGGRLFVPNVFTPNGDGINDFFQLSGNSIEDASYVIHDRWGKLVFEGIYTTTWNGTNNGNLIPDGVYFYHVDYKFSDESIRRETSGSVTIIR